VNPEDFQIDPYLKRIGLVRAPAADERGLKEVHAAQVFTIPFENLDIHLGRPVSLKPEDLVEKIVFRKRGGYCFELNGLLGLALRAIGFTLHPVLARVLYQLPEPTALTHEVLVVNLSGRDWLADAGFGGPGLRLPLEIQPDLVSEQYGDSYRLLRNSIGGWTLQKKAATGFIDLYMFQDTPALDIDIEMSNHFTSTWPSSRFRMHKMCSLASADRRITLLDTELSIHKRGRTSRRTLPQGPAYVEALAEYFGIELGTTYEDFIL
jgi:N-hydroxyarylamine O-acetyltransferase